MQVSDTARYTCVATNDAGKSQQNFDLEILGKTMGPFTVGNTCETADIKAHRQYKMHQLL